MPTMEVPFGVAFDPTSIDRLFELMLNTAQLQSNSSTQAVMTLSNGTATSTLTLTGINLGFTNVGGQMTLSGGTLSGLHYQLSPGYNIFFTELSLAGSSLFTAAQAEISHPSSKALENLLYPLDWTMIGNSYPVNFTATSVNFDGNRVVLGGNDTILLDYGNDTFDSGPGDDRIMGGYGNDSLSGGSGNDTLFGEHGHDRLLGGAGRDRLMGGLSNDTLLGGDGADTLFGHTGADVLLGGAGNDTMNGGPGNDTLSGGAGGDLFIFLESRVGHDVITDFDMSEDRIRLVTDATPMFAQAPDGLLLSFGAESVLLLGLQVGDLSLADIQILSS